MVIIMIKKWYKEEITRVCQKVNSLEKDLVFGIAADSHLDNSMEDFAENIKAVDEKINMKCLTHLGDFMNGNLPRNVTMKVLDEQMTLYRNAVSNKHFYPAQGNHDGFSGDRAVDSDWFEATKFTDSYENVVRPENKPYFYADFEDLKVRFIIVSTFFYEGYDDGTPYKKRDGIDDKQVQWLENEAFDIKEGWTVFLFSHDCPLENYEEESRYKETAIHNGGRIFNSLVEKSKEKGFDIGVWFIGHFHGDNHICVDGINFVTVASQTAYVPTLFDMPLGEYPQRDLNTVTEDSWEIAVWNKEEKTVNLIRFGAGNDRVIKYGGRI